MTPFDKWLTDDEGWTAPIDEYEPVCSHCGATEDQHVVVMVEADDEHWAYERLECVGVS